MLEMDAGSGTITRETLVAPEMETFPNRRWTRDDCRELQEQGRLTGRYELIDGEILSKMGQHPPHRITLHLVGQWLVTLFGYPYVQTENPIEIPGADGLMNEPEPDVAVTREPTTAYFDRHPGPNDILLLVEVSDSTLPLDLTVKALLYARAGIAEYWVFDVAGRQVYRHLQPTLEGYRDVATFRADALIAPTIHPDATMHVGDLFPTAPDAQTNQAE